jgi:hypothetical protein
MMDEFHHWFHLPNLDEHRERLEQDHCAARIVLDAIGVGVEELPELSEERSRIEAPLSSVESIPSPR